MGILPGFEALAAPELLKIDKTPMDTTLLRSEKWDEENMETWQVALFMWMDNNLPRKKKLNITDIVDGDTIWDAWLQVYTLWVKWCQSTGVPFDPKITTHLKSNVYRTVFRPIPLYRAGSWPITKKHESDSAIISKALSVVSIQEPCMK